MEYAPFKMKYKNLKEVVKQLNSAVIAHGKQAKTIDKHINNMEKDSPGKAKGLAAKDRVKQLLDGCENITLKSHGIGKFGRCLGEIMLDKVDGQEKLTLVSLNELLISEKHAVEYHGGKR